MPAGLAHDHMTREIKGKSWGEIAPTRPPTSHQAISPQLLTLLSSLVVFPSLSRRTFKVPGRGPVPQGRPLQERSGKVQMVATEDGNMIARSGKALKFTAEEEEAQATKKCQRK